MTELIIIIICLILNAFFAAFEMAFVALTRSQLKQLAKTGNPTALRLAILKQNPERTLSAIQIGITLVGALAAAIGGAQAYEKLSPYLADRFHLQNMTANVVSVFLVVFPLTMVNVIFSELVPKTLALRSPMKIGLFATKWLLLLDSIFLPLVNFLEWTTKRILTAFFPRSRTDSVVVASDTVELDQLSVQARQYVLNLVAIEKKRVREVSLPWAQVDFVSTTDSIHEVEIMILRSGHTRLPVMTDGQMAGIINTKELIALVKAGTDSWEQIVRPISKVQGADTLLKALRQMQEKRSHLSAVFEGTLLTGIVTMEDVIEEIIGEVYDEDDDGALRRILSARGRR
jgi:putative hemolysin